MIFNRVTLSFCSLKFYGNETLIAKGGGRPLYSMHKTLGKIRDTSKISISREIGFIYSISVKMSQLFLSK